MIEGQLRQIVRVEKGGPTSVVTGGWRAFRLADEDG